MYACTYLLCCLSFIWVLQLNLLSSVTPRYLTSVSCLINLPPSLRNFCFDLCFLLNRTATVFVGLNFRFLISPQWYNLFNILCILLYISCVFSPPIIGPQSSAKPCPVIPYSFIISIASLNAMIQNLAEQTPPCGKPIPTVIVCVYPPIVVVRCLCVIYRCNKILLSQGQHHVSEG